MHKGAFSFCVHLTFIHLILNGGERGIRTLETLRRVYLLSREVLSTAQPSLPQLNEDFDSRGLILGCNPFRNPSTYQHEDHAYSHEPIAVMNIK